MDRRHPSSYSFPMLATYNNNHHHHQAALVPRGWAKASACRLQVSLSCAVLCQIVSLQYLSRSALHLVVFSCRMVSTWWHAGSIGRLWGCWCSRPRTISFFSHIADYSYAFCPLSLTQMLVFLSLYIMLSILLSILVRATAGCLFRACFMSGQVSSLCQSWQHPGVVHICLQADGNVAFEDTSNPGIGVCRPVCHDSSLYILVLVTFREAVVLCVYVSHV